MSDFSVDHRLFRLSRLIPLIRLLPANTDPGHPRTQRQPQPKDGQILHHCSQQTHHRATAPHSPPDPHAGRPSPSPSPSSSSHAAFRATGHREQASGPSVHPSVQPSIHPSIRLSTPLPASVWISLLEVFLPHSLSNSA